MSYRTTKSKIKAESNKAKTFDSINATANIGYTAFFYHTFRNVLIISIPLVIISAIILSSLHISADASNNGSGSSTDTLSFNISSSCTLSSVVDSSHTAELINGTYTNSIGPLLHYVMMAMGIVSMLMGIVIMKRVIIN